MQLCFAYTKCFSQLVKSIVGNKSTFTLVGYSYGGWLAMEACHLMEQREGKIGNLILIDSSPEFLKAAASIWYKDKNEDELQVYVLTHFLKLMTPEMWEKVGQIVIIYSFIHLFTRLTAYKRS